MEVKIYKLNDPDGNDSLGLFSEGEHVIGREIIHCTDKRISRKHATIVIKQDRVLLKSEHVNPCFHKSCIKDSISVLTKGKSVTLNDNDQFALVSDGNWYKVHFIKKFDTKNILSNTQNIHENEIFNSGNVKLKRNNDDLDCISPSKMLKTSNSETSLRSQIMSDSVTLKTVFLEDCIKIESDHLSSELISKSSDVLKCEAIQNDISNNNNCCQNITAIPEDVKLVFGLINDKGDEIINREAYETNITNNPFTLININNNVSDDIRKHSDVEKESSSHVSNDIDSTDNNLPVNRNHLTDVESNGLIVKIRRDRCWYGQDCYRKNLQHLHNFSHPGDNDYDSDPDDNRLICPFGNDCYRLSTYHRREFKHSGKPAKRPQNVWNGCAFCTHCSTNKHV